MSPEQAWGRVGELTPASDIFSLGAILFTIITGKPPRSELTLTAAREGKVDVPSEVQTQVPRALEKICLKAMSRDPLDRYATATAMANDIRNWLADEPVGAWREPFYTRARRWVKKNRVLVGSLAAALVVGVVTLTIMMPMLNEKDRRIEVVQNEKKALELAGIMRESELASSKAVN
jgi:serine/threonine protein kinase